MEGLPETRKVPLPTVTAPVKELYDLVHAKGKTARSALDLMVMCKRVEAFVARLRSTLKADANTDFQQLVAADSDKNRWSAPDNLAMLTRYTPRSTWAYTQELLQVMADVSSQQKAEQKNGKAKKMTPTPDPINTALFSVAVSEKF